jgi:phage shock protein PspC (stress-responsive transcriptional regulator)
MTDHDAPTAQLPPEPPPPPAPEPRKLKRSADDKVLFGVAGGLARHLDVDPVLVRVGFAVLALLGGAGVLLYVVLALVMPGDGAGEGPSDTALSTGAIVVLILLGLVTLPFIGDGFFFFAPGIAFVILFAVVCILLVRAMRGENASAGRILLALLAIAFAAVLGFGAAAGVAFGGGTIVAIVAVGLGVALIVAGVLGGARWLVLPALAVAIPAVLVAASGLDLRGGVGNREINPTTQANVQAQYRLGAGRLAVDLRNVDFKGVQDLDLEVGMGRIELLVPRNVCVQTNADVAAGDIDLFGRHTSGVDVGVGDTPAPKPGRAVLRIDGDITMGQLAVNWNEDRLNAQNRGFQRGDTDGLQKACLS